MKIENLAGYELIEKHQITELDSVGYLLKHKKSGARIALLSNDDENKVARYLFIVYSVCWVFRRL